MKRRTLVLIMLSILLLGAAGVWWASLPSEFEEKFAGIKEGMTRGEVYKILGQPVQENEDAAVWGNLETHVYLVCFNENTVVLVPPPPVRLNFIQRILLWLGLW